MIADHDTAVLALKAAAEGQRILGDHWVVWLNDQFLHDDQFRAAMPHPPVWVSRHQAVIVPPPQCVVWPPGDPLRWVPLPPVLVDLRFGRKASRRSGRPADTALPPALQRLTVALTELSPTVLLAVLAGLAVPRPGETRKGAIRALAVTLSDDPREQDRIRALITSAARRTRGGSTLSSLFGAGDTAGQDAAAASSLPARSQLPGFRR
jgi:hypothetical protein